MKLVPVLSVEETREVANAKKLSFQTFVVCMLAIDEFRDALILTWQDRVAAGRPVAKLSEDYGSSRFTLDEIRNQVNENLTLACKARRRVDRIRYIVSANLATSLYEDTYKSLTMGGKKKAVVDARYAEYLKHRNKLFESNLRLVPKFVGPFARQGVDFDDLVQEGRLGLLRAVEKYDPSKEVRFSSYASWWIKQAIRKSLKNDRRTVRLPHHIYDYLAKVAKHSSAFRIQHRREPSLRELMALTGYSAERIEGLVGVMSDLISLESPMRVSKEEIKDLIPSDCAGEVPAESAVLSTQMQKLITQALNVQEAEIIRRHYGLGETATPGGEMLADIGSGMGITAERARQIENVALQKLHEILAAEM